MLGCRPLLAEQRNRLPDWSVPQWGAWRARATLFPRRSQLGVPSGIEASLRGSHVVQSLSGTGRACIEYPKGSRLVPAGQKRTALGTSGTKRNQTLARLRTSTNQELVLRYGGPGFCCYYDSCRTDMFAPATPISRFTPSTKADGLKLGSTTSYSGSSNSQVRFPSNRIFADGHVCRT